MITELNHINCYTCYVCGKVTECRLLIASACTTNAYEAFCLECQKKYFKGEKMDGRATRFFMTGKYR